MKWFAVEDLKLADVPVIFRFPGGVENVGYVRFSNTGKKQIIIKKSGLEQKLSKKTPPPICWRPAIRWPERLPELEFLEPEKSSKRISDLPEEVTATSVAEWPYTGLELNSWHVSPQGVKEAEARLLRWIRTAKVLDKEFPKQMSTWPPGLIKKAQAVAASLARVRRAQYWGESPNRDDLHEIRLLRKDDMADIEEIMPSTNNRVPWRPTPRDVSEFENSKIITKIPDTWKRIFAIRSKDPPYTFAMIADICQQPEEVIYESYCAVCQNIYKGWSA